MLKQRQETGGIFLQGASPANTHSEQGDFAVNDATHETASIVSNLHLPSWTGVVWEHSGRRSKNAALHLYGGSGLVGELQPLEHLREGPPWSPAWGGSLHRPACNLLKTAMLVCRSCVPVCCAQPHSSS